MKKILAVCLLLLATPLFAQVTYSTVSGKILDPNGNPYANASLIATLVNSQGYPVASAATPNGQLFNGKYVKATLDTTGYFSIGLVPNSILSNPSGTQWKIVISSPADTNILTVGPSWNITYQIPVTGPINLSSQLSALAQPVNFVNLLTGQSTIGGGTGNYLPIGGGTLTGPLTAPALTLNGTGCGSGTYALADGTGCGPGGSTTWNAMTTGIQTGSGSSQENTLPGSLAVGTGTPTITLQNGNGTFSGSLTAATPLQAPIYPTTYLTSVLLNNDQTGPHTFTSIDQGASLSPITGAAGNDIYTDATGWRDGRFLVVKYGGQNIYWQSYTNSTWLPGTANSHIGLAYSTDMINWTKVTTPTWGGVLASNNWVWNGCWYTDASGNIWMTFGLFGGVSPYTVSSWIVQVNPGSTPASITFGTPTQITYSPTRDFAIPMALWTSAGSTWALIQDQYSTTNQIELAQISSGLSGSWNIVGAGDWAGWGFSHESGSLLVLPNGNLRAFMVDTSGGFEDYSDSNSPNPLTATWSALTRIAPCNNTNYRCDWVDVTQYADIQSDQVFNALQRSTPALGTTVAQFGTNNVNVFGGIIATQTTGNNNLAISPIALNSLTTGSNNTGAGYDALESVVSGSYNAGFGSYACTNITGSNSNLTCLGAGAAQRLADGTNNTGSYNSTYVGEGIMSGAANSEYEFVVGQASPGHGINSATFGDATRTLYTHLYGITRVSNGTIGAGNAVMSAQAYPTSAPNMDSGTWAGGTGWTNSTPGAAGGTITATNASGYFAETPTAAIAGWGQYAITYTISAISGGCTIQTVLPLTTGYQAFYATRTVTGTYTDSFLAQGVDGSNPTVTGAIAFTATGCSSGSATITVSSVIKSTRGLIATNNLFLAGQQLNNTSSPNTQIVTCPAGGTGQQYCAANGAWISSSTGGVTHTAVISALTTNTGATTETVKAYFAMPTTLGSTAMIDVNAAAAATSGNTGTCTPRIKFNSSSAAGGVGVVSGISLTNTPQTTYMSGTVRITGASTEVTAGSQVNSGSGVSGQSSTATYTVASGTYILFTMQNSVSGDTCSYNFADVVVYPN